MLHAKYSHYNSLEKLTKISRDITLQEDLIDFLQEDPTPTDDQVHNLAEQENIDPSKLEEQSYQLLGDIVGKGKSIEEPDQKFPQNQLQEGLKIESEHTDNPLIQEKITKDHLVEDPEYYSKLLEAGL